MIEAYVDATYMSIEKPFEIVARLAHCGGTEKWTIAFISEDNARILVQSGLSWKNGEPDWEKHYHRIETMKAERDLKSAQKRLAELAKNKNPGAQGSAPGHQASGE
jgi:hypothetical protein